MSGLSLMMYSHCSYRTNKATNSNISFNELKKNIGEGDLVS